MGASARLTNNYYFSASSSQGAVGDVVGVDISLTVDSWLSTDLFGFECLGCFDRDKVELVGVPLFSEQYDDLAAFTYFYPLGGDNGPTHPQQDGGFMLAANIRPSIAEAVLRGGRPLPLMSLFFRLKGPVGDTVEIRFCDAEFVSPGGPCELNRLLYAAPGQVPRSVEALSERHVSGGIRILAGDATQTEPPDLPPGAKVYPEAPTAETTEILFELSGAVAGPGDTDVPLRLYITSSHEFTSFCVGVTFPPGLARVARVEEAIRPGAVVVDNERGTLGILLQDSVRRIGREGERVHVATIYVDVSPTAESTQIPFRFERVGGFVEWVGIRHTGGVNAEPLPVVEEVAPVQLQSGMLAIQLRGTSRGDVNLDYTLDIVDATAILSYLFLRGETLRCPSAADVNGDGLVNVSDPIRLLRALFDGASLPDSSEAFCGGE